MAKPPSPLVGYNNNVRHKNRVFHIQTEDSGIARPHIITHLFMDGGRILKSVKTSYAEHVGADGMAETVRQMMKDQHKAMFIALRDGQFDHLVDGPPAEPRPPSPSIADAVSLVPLSASASSPASVPSSTGAPVSPIAAVPAPVATPAPPVASAVTAQPFAAAPPVAAPVAPPAIAGRPSTTMSAVTAPVTIPPPTVREGRETTEPFTPPKGDPAPRAPNGDGRYAPARPAAIFGPARPAQGSSIFGEDLIGDKSLDEVILSYLAEDLEGERK